MEALLKWHYISSQCVIYSTLFHCHFMNFKSKKYTVYNSQIFVFEKDCKTR